jgi:hypothetical protein
LSTFLWVPVSLAASSTLSETPSTVKALLKPSNVAELLSRHLAFFHVALSTSP